MPTAGPPFSKRVLVGALLLGLVSFLASRLAILFLIEPEGMAPFWFANAVVLVFLLRRPRREWPFYLFAAFVGFVLNMSLLGFPLLPNVFYGFANVLEATIAALLVTRLAPRFALRSVRAFGILAAASVLACVVGATTAWLAGPVRWDLWMIDDLLGMLLVAPALLVFWPSKGRPSLRPPLGLARAAEAIAIAAGLAAITVTIFYGVFGLNALQYFYLVVPFMLWATLRFMDKGAILSAAWLALLTIGLTIRGVGPFAADALVADRSLAIQLFVCAVMLSHLVLGIMLVERARIATICRGQVDILERIGRREPLSEVLRAIVKLVETHETGLFASLLTYENGRLYHGAAPSLPPAYNQAINGAQAGPNAGSCGAAASRGERVIVEDVATHPNWKDYKHLALPHGLRACWSTPILSARREVLGTFAIYYKECRVPDEEEIAWVDAATSLAAIVYERDATERAVRRTEEDFRRVIETASEGVSMMDADRNITYVNLRMAQMLGRTPQELLGRSVFDFVHPEEAANMRARLALRSRGHSAQYETRLLHADGSTVWNSVSGSPIVGDDGSVQGSLSMHTDITDRKREEEERRKLEAHMIQTQRMESLGTLAGGIAHDFNNILTAMMGNLGMARRTLTPDHPALARLDVIATACARAGDLVRQILTFSRRGTPHRNRVRLQPLVEEATRLLRAVLPARVKLDTKTEGADPVVLADASQLHQIVMNLGTNAMHALGSEGGTLAVELTVLKLSTPLSGVPSTIPPGEYARLTVRDDGIGMNATTQARIFDPFFTTKAPGEGTGLGLAVVLGIVGSHGGLVTVTSALGEGTSFDVYLPLAPPARAIHVVAEPMAQPTANGERILFVDDEVHIVDLVADELRELGYEIVGFTDAVQAHAAITADTYFAILSDFAMPALNGLELARHARDVAPSTPFVIVTGHPSPDLEERAKVLGVTAILSKPGFLDELPKLLARFAQTSVVRQSES